MVQPFITSEQTLAVFLSRALDLLTHQDAKAAEIILSAILTDFPSHPDALHLMGGVRGLQQRTEEAKEFYLRSLLSAPNQPRVFVSLGLLFSRQGHLNEAIDAYQEAIRLAPDHVLAQLSLGVALHKAGHLSEAETAFRRVLHLDHTHIEGRLALAAALNNQRRYEEAEQTLTAVQSNVWDAASLAELEYLLGVARSGQHEHQAALAHFESAMQATRNPDAVQHSKANALRFLGQEEEAISTFRRALAYNPLNLKAHHELNQLLYRLKRDDEFLSSYDDAAAVAPDLPSLPLGKAKFLLSQQRDDEARSIYERVLIRFPENLEALNGLAVANLRLKRFDKAIAAYQRGLSVAPSALPLRNGLAAVYLTAGDPQAAAVMAEQSCQLDTHNQTALAILGTAWRLLGDEREFYLNDYDALIQIYDIEPPPGYPDIASYNRELDAYLDRLHPGGREYVDQSLRHGTQTVGDLFGMGHSLVENLGPRIKRAVHHYIEDMHLDNKHPLMSRKTSGFAFGGSWSSRLKDSGYHTNHIHPEGWISSVYYVALPESVMDTEKRSGWLKFGEPSYDIPFAAPVRRAVQPKVGQLVLFPSYMWHGTIAFHSAISRTTIAFDAVPSGT